MLDRVSDFLFDVVGLIAPGIIIVIILALPFYGIREGMAPDQHQGLKMVIASIGKVQTQWSGANTTIFPWVLLASIGLGAYLAGHSAKVLSKLFYTVFGDLFDDGIFRAASWLSVKFPKLKLLSKLYSVPILRFPLRILRNALTFDPPDHYKENTVLQEWIKKELTSKGIQPISWEWYNLYRHSVLVMQQKQIPNLSPHYLAKYNMYRSLSFVFFAYFFFMWWFFSAEVLSDPVQQAKTLALGSIAILWYTFHDKFKYYWTLCGNEAIVGYFTHLLLAQGKKKGLFG